MYKLTLCLKYLLRRPLAYFAVFGVAVCVLMMLICVSILTGFVNKIEVAAKGLFSDVIVSSPSLGGVGRYDEFITRIKKEVPEVEDASPFILTFGILQLPPTDFRKTVQVTGIRLPDRAAVSDFEKGLFVQEGVAEPTFDPPESLVLNRLRQELVRTNAILGRMRAKKDLRPSDQGLIERLETAVGYQEMSYDYFVYDERARRAIEDTRRRIEAAEQAGDDELLMLLERRRAAYERQIILAPDRRAILGLGVAGLTFRTPEGETVRIVAPGQQIALTTIPLGRQISYTDITPVTRTFTVIDDCSTDVSSIDSDIVYVPFDTLQRLNNMAAEYAPGDANVVVRPGRCSQIHVKVREEFSRGEALVKVARKIQDVWEVFHKQHPDASTTTVTVETWRERQRNLLEQIGGQRVVMVIILGVISTVAVVLIFVILYVIVIQKTRDIGVLKAVGASNVGVAGIFLAYGGAIGLVGSILGALGGSSFVWNINPIHDWVGRTFGFRVWSPENYMFAEIPNEVQPEAVAWIVGGAIFAGVFGALLPSVLAARRQPVEALRYE